MEDNSAVVIISNKESEDLKKCIHFIMVVNYVRKQLELGLIQQVFKIKGELNNADLHNTKNLRDKSFATKADSILGSPAAPTSGSRAGQVTILRSRQN